jgi:RND family efflux transporter MFP subunit
MVAIAAGLGLARWALHPKSTAAGPASRTSDFAMRVEVVHPTKGGLGRTVKQPGVVHAFNKAELFAKVSGYLVRQKVDIGDMVKKGDVLAEIDIPELFKSADQAKAALEQEKAKVKQSEARILTAVADRESAAAAVQEAQANIAKFTADRDYRKKELDRITGLFRQKAVAAELVDEQQRQYEAALAAERSGEAAVATARAQLSAAAARVEQARADAEAARSDVDSAAADLAKAEVLLDYTRITSPYDGVITLRSFHDGDFVRSAAEGGTIPVLSVKQNDPMRVVILVPDLDVPYVKRGDPATIRIDALQDRTFEGKIARFANSENEQKLMRTEVDLPNPDNLLRDGMYGTATLHLEPPSNNLTVPSSCLISQDGLGNGAVYVVRDGKAHLQPIRVDLDDGKSVEVVQGLSPDDQVVVRYSGTIAEGLAVQVEPLKQGP